MTNPSLPASLQAPFPEDELIWKVGEKSTDESEGRALPHLDARHIQNRLDTVVGPMGWSDEYIEVMAGSRLLAVRCRLTLVVEGVRVAKEDAAYVRSTAATDRDRELEVKGAYSNALKRAAVKWGIGRYLYEFKAPFVPLVDGQFAERPSLEKLRELANRPAVAAATVAPVATTVEAGAESGSKPDTSSSSVENPMAEPLAHTATEASPSHPAEEPSTPAPEPVAEPTTLSAPDVSTASKMYQGLLQRFQGKQVAMTTLLDYISLTGVHKMSPQETAYLRQEIAKRQAEESQART